MPTTMKERIAALSGGSLVDETARQHYGGVGAPAFGGNFGDSGLRLAGTTRSDSEPELRDRPSLA